MEPLFIAGLLAVILGVVHTVLGEKLIFSGWRVNPPNIPCRHYNIIWATWHLVTLTCIALGIILIYYGRSPVLIDKTVLAIMMTAFTLAAGLVLIATRAKHPGWVVLFIVAGLILLSL